MKVSSRQFRTISRETLTKKQYFPYHQMRNLYFISNWKAFFNVKWKYIALQRNPFLFSIRIEGSFKIFVTLGFMILINNTKLLCEWKGVNGFRRCLCRRFAMGSGWICCYLIFCKRQKINQAKNQAVVERVLYRVPRRCLRLEKFICVQGFLGKGLKTNSLWHGILLCRSFILYRFSRDNPLDSNHVH